MKQRQAAARYAKALFALAKERNQTGPLGRELGDVVAMYDGSPELREFFARPSMPRTAKRKAAEDIARRSGLSTLTGNLLALVAERGRATHLGAITETYEKLLDVDLGRARARVRSAISLTDDERQRLAAKLAGLLHADQVVFDEVVDPTLLGGFVVESGTILLDGSLKGQLDTVRRRLEKGMR